MARILIVAVMVLLAGCGGGGGGSTGGTSAPVVSNSAPVANAGQAQTVNVGTLVTLNGTGSTDPDKDALTYAWQLTDKPSGSAATLPASTASQPTFTPDKPGTYTATLVVNDGKLNSAPVTVTITAKSVGFSSLPPAQPITEVTIPDWLITRYTSPLTGRTTVTLDASSLEGDFIINCNGDGTFSYYFSTASVTANGLVSMRVGTNPVVSETWYENGSTYRTLTPPTSDIELLKKLYKNWDFVFQYYAYSGGAQVAEIGSSGFSSAIDQTRAECKWSTTDFPPQNGWGKPLPLTPPDDAIEARYATDLDVTQQVRLIAWRATNASGQTQILARVGDAANSNNQFLMSDRRLYVIQDNRLVSAVSGYDFGVSASQPIILALNGDFDASRPLTLTLVKFHFHTTDQLVPTAAVDFK